MLCNMGLTCNAIAFLSQNIPNNCGFAFCLLSADQFGSCSKWFMCSNNRCIDPDLVCDSVDHCTDLSDESRDGLTECGKIGNF